MVRESGRGRRRGRRDKGKVRRGREGPQTHSEQSGFCGYEILVYIMGFVAIKYWYLVSSRVEPRCVAAWQVLGSLFMPRVVSCNTIGLGQGKALGWAWANLQTRVELQVRLQA